MHHPFIVSLHHTFQTHAHLYFCMEYCAGGEFYRALQLLPGKSLCEADARFYAAEVTCALEFLHLMGFIYRDLKPENILLHSSGHIMLADFDLSKSSVAPMSPNIVHKYQLLSGGRDFLSDHLPSVSPILNTHAIFTHMRTKSLVGTEEYLAPEIISGLHYAISVDWWAFGILLYEMLHGRTPFKGRSRLELFENILSQEVKLCPPRCQHRRLSNLQKFSERQCRPLSLPPLTSDCRHLISKLLQKLPKNRLGCRYGASEIKSHRWFKTTEWALIRNQKPPLMPHLLHRLDVGNFGDFTEAEESERKCCGVEGSAGGHRTFDPEIKWQSLAELIDAEHACDFKCTTPSPLAVDLNPVAPSSPPLSLKSGTNLSTVSTTASGTNSTATSSNAATLLSNTSTLFSNASTPSSHTLTSHSSSTSASPPTTPSPSGSPRLPFIPSESDPFFVFKSSLCLGCVLIFLVSLKHHPF